MTSMERALTTFGFRPATKREIRKLERIHPYWAPMTEVWKEPGRGSGYIFRDYAGASRRSDAHRPWKWGRWI